MKAFVLSIFNRDGADVLAVVLASSRGEALRLIGSIDDDNGKSTITVPSCTGNRIRKQCLNANASRDLICLDEVPVITTS